MALIVKAIFLALFLVSSASQAQALGKKSEGQTILSISTPNVTSDGAGKVVEIFSGSNWKIFRNFPGGNIDISHRSAPGEAWKQIDLQLEWRRRIYPMFVQEDRGALYIASYDLIDTIPSGRSQKIVKDGIDMWRIDQGSPDAPLRIASGLSLGGIDTPIYAAIQSHVAIMCGGNTCYSISLGEQPKLWSLAALGDFEFVEVAFQKKRAAAIVRRKHDDRQNGPVSSEYALYYLAFMGEGGVVLSPIDEPGIPWGIHWSNGRASYNLAKSQDQYADVFVYDVQRFGLNGVLEFGNNNLEGRIAWKQVYYLNGLISAISEPVSRLFQEFLPDIRNRVVKEVALIDELCNTTYPAFMTKRYSVDREPLTSVVHIGRVITTLIRAQATTNYSISESCMAKLQSYMEDFEDTLEEPITIDAGDDRLPYLRIRPSMPFWADGINVPYNYVSGYAEGSLLTDLTPERKATIDGMLQVIRNDEFSNELPLTWRYCGGLCDKGWVRADGISVNTPNWHGNGRAMAHISYRTMDARALLQLYRALPNEVDPNLITHFVSLTERGWLLPSLNEVLVHLGRLAKLSDDVVRRNARAAAPWELQSSVWALYQLSEDLD